MRSEPGRVTTLERSKVWERRHPCLPALRTTKEDAGRMPALPGRSRDAVLKVKQHIRDRLQVDIRPFTEQMPAGRIRASNRDGEHSCALSHLHVFRSVAHIRARVRVDR